MLRVRLRIQLIVCLAVILGCHLWLDREKQLQFVSEIFSLTYPYSVEWGGVSLDGGYQTSGIFHGAGKQEFLSFNFNSFPGHESHRLSLETRRFAARRREVDPASEEARAFVTLVRLQVEESVSAEVVDNFVSHSGDFREFPGFQNLEPEEIKLLLLLKQAHWTVVRASDGS